MIVKHSLHFEKKHKLKVFENVLTKIFGLKRDTVSGAFRI